MKINTKTIVDAIPGLALGAGIGAVIYYFILKRENGGSVHPKHTCSGHDSGGGNGGTHECNKDKDKGDLATRKQLGRADQRMDKYNKDMKLGPGGYRKVHNRRGTIQVGGKRREVTMDDGFDASAYDYETLYGDPKIVQFSFGGLSI